MPSAVWTAIALVLLLEGLPLLLVPNRWRDIMRQVSGLADGQLRFFGLLMVLSAVGLLVLAGGLWG